VGDACQLQYPAPAELEALIRQSYEMLQPKREEKSGEKKGEE